jgi:tetratricopeptide (TPR) repeat protein/predicted aspartyl protease
VLLGSATAVAASGDCKLSILLQLPITMGGSFKPMADARINGHDVTLLIDSGAFYSMLSPSTAAEFGLRLEPVPWLTLNGVGGGTVNPRLTTATLTLGGVTIPRKLEFLVGGNEIGGGARGALGQNILRIADVEYDLANGVIRLIKPEGKCKSMRPTYWARPGDAYSEMDIRWATPSEPFTTGVGYLNGSKIDVLFDTGSWGSMLSLRAAARAGIKTDSPGVVPGGVTHGVGPGGVPTWIAPFQSFKIGDEEIRNTHLRIGAIDLRVADMLIGADFFLSHRVYVASSERKLYFTYNGGPVFNLTTQPEGGRAADQKPAPSPQDLPASTQSNTAPVNADTKPPAGDEANQKQPTGEDSDGDELPAIGTAAGGATARDTTLPAGEPTTADEFFRRGTAYLYRHDFERALADLRRACELNPREPRYFLERATVYWHSNQPDLSDADVDMTLKLKPDYIEALVWRAQREVTKHAAAAALADLDTADRAAAPQEILRLGMGRTYLRAGSPSQAIRQYSLWIDAHGEDIRAPEAYVMRCWARGLSGQELEQGLSDCNRGLRRVTDKSPGLAGRGLVYLRLGNFKRAISDYSDALKVRPKNAWALYGRGIAESRLKDSTAADADFTAATALAPHIAEEFKKHGIAP